MSCIMFTDAASAQVSNLRGHDCLLTIRQQPKNAKVALGKEKDRKPIDPPPIIQLKIINNRDPTQAVLQSPYFFMSAHLLKGGEMQQGSGSNTNVNTSLAGTLVSSLHRLKDIDNSDGGFFVFADLSVKVEGTYRLQFNLYEMRPATLLPEQPPVMDRDTKHPEYPSHELCQTLISRRMEVHHLTSTTSDEFKVDIPKNFPGMAESTQLTRSFSDQGVKLRLRKEPRTLLRKRGPASDNYEPMHYRSKAQRSSSTSAEYTSSEYASTESESVRSRNQAGRSSDMSGEGHASHEFVSKRYRSQGGSGSDLSGEGLAEGLGRMDLPTAAGTQQRVDSRGIQNIYYPPIPPSNVSSWSPRRPGSEDTSAPTKFEHLISPPGNVMMAPFQPQFSSSIPHILSSQQQDTPTLAVSVLHRPEEYGRNTSRPGSNIARQRHRASDYSLNFPTHIQSIGSFTGGSGNQFVPTHTSLPSSNRVIGPEFGGAYTHQPPTLARHQTPQSQTYQINNSQHSHTRSQTSLTSQSPTTSGGTPHSLVSFGTGSGDTFTGMAGSSTFTSPLVSPSVESQSRQEFVSPSLGSQRLQEWRIWPHPEDERTTLAARQSEATFSTPTPRYGPKHNATSGINRQQTGGSRSMYETNIHGHGLGLSVGPDSTLSSYMPPPNSMQSTGGYPHSISSSMSSNNETVRQERRSSGGDAASPGRDFLTG